MSTEYFEVAVGTPVRSADGEELGDVKEVVGRFFKIDAPMRPDYWLSTEIVRSAHESAVVLSVNDDALGGYEVSDDDLEAERAGLEIESELVETDDYTNRDAAVEAAAIVWGPDEWAVVRSRILEREEGYTEDDLDRMHEEDPHGLRERFAHLIEDADRSAEELARTVERNT